MEEGLTYTKDIKPDTDVKRIKKLFEKNFANIPIKQSLRDKVYNKIHKRTNTDWKQFVKEYYVESEYNDILNSTITPDSRIIYLYDKKELVGLIKLVTKDKERAYLRDCFDYEVSEEDAVVTLFHLKKDYYSYLNSIIKEMEKELPVSLNINNLKFISNYDEDFLLALVNNGYNVDREYQKTLILQKNIRMKEEDYARKRKFKWNTSSK